MGVILVGFMALGKAAKGRSFPTFLPCLLLLLKMLIFYWREVSPTILNENMRGKGWGGELGSGADGGTFTFPRASEPYSQRLNRDLS